MNDADRDLLEVIARDAPTPGPRYADNVLIAARRRHRRRSLTWLTGLVVAGGLTAATLTVSLAGVENSSGPDAAPPADQPSVRDSSQFYAAAIEHLATEMQVGDQAWRVLYVLDHTCSDVLTPLNGCGGSSPFSVDAKRDLTKALESFAPVEFVSDPDSVREGIDQHVINGGVLVTLGPTDKGEGQAIVRLSVERADIFGEGHGYRVIEDGGTYVVQETDLPQWIS